MNNDNMNPLPDKYDDGDRKRWVAEALGIDASNVFFAWQAINGWPLVRIQIRHEGDGKIDGLTAPEIAKLMLAGIVPTAGGWAFAKEQTK